MKTKIGKRIAMCSLLVPVFGHGAATPEQYPNEMLASHLNTVHTVLHDSLGRSSDRTDLTVTTIALQAPVQQFTAQYLKEHGALLDQIKEHNSATFRSIQQILVQRGIPAELLYLAVVESKMKNNATSGAGAAGVWQLMPATAKYLGLTINKKTDQRRHIYHSSVAAAKYLNELYKQFDDWLLVVAAYNCGSGNVYKAIKQAGSREFWKLQRFLPTETSNHVKRFIATHHYYEEQGSIVTLTKKERNKHFALLEEIARAEEENNNDDSPAPANHPRNWVLIAQQDGELRFELRK
jgi:membrane-bound lytic murein transglycosylase D